MEQARVALVTFIALTVVFASISVYEYASPNRPSSSSSSIPSYTITQSRSSSLLGASGRLVVQGIGTFDYLQRNSSTPNQFALDDVRFSLWTNSTVTYTGGQCYLGSYAGYVAAFSDGSTERFTACLSGPYPYTQILFTDHVRPQAGLLISGVNGDVYFLVSV